MMLAGGEYATSNARSYGKTTLGASRLVMRKQRRPRGTCPWTLRSTRTPRPSRAPYRTLRSEELDVADRLMALVGIGDCEPLSRMMLGTRTRKQMMGFIHR